MYRPLFIRNMRNSRRQIGMTLVELMIGMVLGLFLIGGVTAMFISSKQGFRLQTGLTDTQQRGRAIITMLTQDMELAGYPKMDGIAAIIPTYSLDGGGTASDQVAVMYNSAFDCLGNATPVYGTGKQYAKNIYSIVNNNLVCTTRDEANSVLNSQVIAEGVENLQVLYGEDRDATDGVANATNYVRADRVSNWSNVVSVRVAILVNSLDTIDSTPDTATFNLLGQGTIGAAGDLLRRRSYSTTVVIRNRRV